MIEKTIKLIFVYNKAEKEVLASVGESILDVAIRNDIPLDGSCGGNCACATCHVIIDPLYFNNDLAQVSDMEENILDMVPNLKATSRLACQVIVSEIMDNMKIFLED